MTDIELISNGGVALRKCYAAWSRDKDVLVESTSGGAFTELAKVVLKDGGIIVGAAYVNGLVVVHRVAHSLDEMKTLRGVKYVQSVIPKSVYGEMSTALRERRRTLFVGTPCQVAAMRKRFGRDDNLILCDLVCFGAPSQRLWLKYVRWYEGKKGKRLLSINSRDKMHGWGRRTYCRYDWADGTTTRSLSDYDPYLHAFFSRLGLRTCCFKCQFRGFDRVSDITICDMWSAFELGLDPDVLHGGVSGVIIHSDIGRQLFDHAEMERVAVSPVQMLSKNPRIVESGDKPTEWDEFQRDANVMKFGELIARYRLQRTWFTFFRQRVWRVIGFPLRRLRRLLTSCAFAESIVEKCE